MKMQISNYIVLAAGLALILGARNKQVVATARKVGHSLAFLQRGSFAMSKLDEKDKDRIAKLWLVWLGGFLVIGSLLAALF